MSSLRRASSSAMETINTPRGKSLQIPTDGSPLLRIEDFASLRLSATWGDETDLERNTNSVDIRNGSVFSSAVNLAACAFGASMLSLPYAMMLGGPVASLVLLVGFAFIAFLAGQAIVDAGLRTNKSTYEHIVEESLGITAGFIAGVMLNLALLVAGISYIVGLSDLAPKLFPVTSSIASSVRVPCLLLLMFPMTLISSLSAFGPVSAIASAGCYVEAVAVVLELFYKTGSDDIWAVPSLSVLLNINWSGLVYVSPMICFVYAYHYVLTETLCELKNPTYWRMTLVNMTSIVTLFGCYVPLSISGYLNYSGVGIPPNMLTKLNENSAAVAIARVVIAGLLFFTYPLFIIPLRRRIEKQFFGSLSTSIVSLRRAKVAGCLAVVVCAVAMFLPDLSLANTLAGGCIATVMLIFPGALDLQGAYRERARYPIQLALGTVFLISGVVVLFVGLFGSLLLEN